MEKYSLENLELKGKKVFLRVDFNLPLDKNNHFSDTTRMEKTLPTIFYLLEKGAKVAIFSHLGRPQGREERLSLRPLAEILQEKIGKKVLFCTSMEVEEVSRALQQEKYSLILVENTRFFSEEKSQDENFCKNLASIFDCYVNDSFGTAHRKESSNYAIASYFSSPACGFLLKKEIESLSYLLENPTRPFVAILGGAKVKDKIAAIENLLPLVDNLLIGGGMAYSFLKILGKDVGHSILDKKHFSMIENLLEKNKNKIQLPEDHLVTEKIGSEVLYAKEIPNEKMGVDIGEQTILKYKKYIKQAKTIFWNGPLGVFEEKNSAEGTFALAKAVAESPAFQVIGGGDSILAINRLSLADKISHISTGGGAAIEFIAGRELPAIKILKDL